MDLCERAYDPRRPTLCFDEQNVQLLADSRPALPLKPGSLRRRDYEYVRHGTRTVFIFLEPKAGRRHLLLTRRRTQPEWAKAIRYLVDVLYPDAPLIDLVYDNLNTHAADTLIEIFGTPEADRILSRLVLHPMPLHASWLNMAEIDLSAMTRRTPKGSAVSHSPERQALMRDESRCLTSLAWTHTCQRSRDLCRSSSTLCGVVPSERVAHNSLQPTPPARLFVK
ncbi:MAG: transposase [Anaerolineae bacterium]